MAEETHFDVLVVGAGISGIGAGYHLQTECPDRSYVILEGRDDLGGTWDLFRYPGIRSDSDMHTLGYSFRPWTEAKSIADGPAILKYVRETAQEFGIDQHIRFNHMVNEAEWSTDDGCWKLSVTHNGEPVTYTGTFLFMCSGYYSYKGGYTPDFPGRDDFTGTIVHPQEWPDELDYADKKIVVIGSGATAVTLVPAMADKAEHVTMLQRSPTYMVARPDQDAFANTLRRVLPDQMAYDITRWKNQTMGEFFYKQTRTKPEKVREKLLGMVQQQMGEDYNIDTHFSPTYNPWDQRLCLVPNADFFEALKAGQSSIVTDHIDRFTPTGIRLQSGEELECDIIVTATGLQLVTVGEMDFFVDGEQIDFSQKWTYKGIAYSDIPNMVSTFGYINASWTLRADLTSEYVCRLLNHMAATGTDQCTPRLRVSDRDMPQRPWIDDFSSGYMQRMMAMMPRQGDRAPWVNTQRLSADKKLLRKGDISDGVMQFTTTNVRQPA